MYPDKEEEQHLLSLLMEEECETGDDSEEEVEDQEGEVIPKIGQEYHLLKSVDSGDIRLVDLSQSLLLVDGEKHSVWTPRRHTEKESLKQQKLLSPMTPSTGIVDVGRFGQSQVSSTDVVGSTCSSARFNPRAWETMK